MRRAWALLLLTVVVGGCDAPTRPEHTERITSYGIDAVIASDGNVHVSATIDYPSDDGGPFRISAPTLGTIRDVSVSGSPRSASGTSVDLDQQGRHAEITWTVEGAVERYADGAVVTLPIWTKPNGVSADDTRVPFEGSVALPGPPVGEVRWHGASPAVRVRNGGAIQLLGDIATTTDSELSLLLPSDAVPDAPLLAGASRVASYEDRQAPKDAADRKIADDIKSDKEHEDLVANIYWAAVGLEIAIPFLITLFVLSRAAATRRRATKGVPEESTDPPSNLHPAVVALLRAEGTDIGADAAAATILDLARRKSLSLEGVGGQRYTVKVTGGSDLEGERALLAALQSQGEVVGPPFPVKRDGAWWSALRHDVVTFARAQHLLRRRYPSGLFLTSVVALAITTIPLYARSPETLVGGFVVAAILSALPFVGGFVLTASGHRERARWMAYRKHLEGGDLGDVDPAGVIIWEDGLVYAAALGVATTAIGELS